LAHEGVHGGSHHEAGLTGACGPVEHDQLHVWIEQVLHGQGLLGVPRREAEDGARSVDEAFSVPVLGEAQVLEPTRGRVGAGDHRAGCAAEHDACVPQWFVRGVHGVEGEPALARRAAVHECRHGLFVGIDGHHAAIDLVDPVQLYLAVTEILCGDAEGVALEEQVGVLGDDHHVIAGLAVVLGHLGDAAGAGNDEVVTRVRGEGLGRLAVRLPGEHTSRRGWRVLGRQGLVLQESLDVVVNEVTTPVLEDLPRDMAGSMTDAFRLAPRSLQASELLDHLMEEDDHVAIGEEPIESIGVLDQSRGVRDVDRSGEQGFSRVHGGQSTIECGRFERGDDRLLVQASSPGHHQSLRVM